MKNFLLRLFKVLLTPIIVPFTFIGLFIVVLAQPIYWLLVSIVYIFTGISCDMLYCFDRGLYYVIKYTIDLIWD